MSVADSRLLAVCHRFRFFAGLVLQLMGGMVLLGWATDNAVLRGFAPGLVPMNPATAVAFILAGMALLCMAQDARSRLALACGLGVVLIGATRLLAYMSPLDLAPDQILFPDRLGGNLIAPNTAFNLLVDGTALVMIVMGVAIPAAQVLVMLAAAVAFMALLGYVFHVPLSGLPGYIPMALNTALCFLTLELGLLASSAGRGPVAELMSQLAGGRVARRLLVAAVLLPLGLGWLGSHGARQFWFSPEFGIALVVTLSVLGMLVLIVLSARQLNRGDAEIERLLTIDPLTDLLNRRTIMELLGNETASALRYRLPLITAMVDIDFFKQVNDSHGHAAGDAVLHMIGVLIKSTLRETDRAGRYGGEEFVIVLPHTDMEGGLAFGERLRQRIAETDFKLASGKHLTVTCSIGISQVIVTDRPQPELALALADQALYTAKRDGRNRVQSAERAG